MAITNEKLHNSSFKFHKVVWQHIRCDVAATLKIKVALFYLEHGVCTVCTVNRLNTAKT